MSEKAYLVEVIRYGDPELGVQFFGVFTDYDSIRGIMEDYNSYRGGKYPSYYVTEITTNASEMQRWNDTNRQLVEMFEQ